MKIAISGKGGVGKTTIAALLAQSWVAAGFKVLAIDADPVSSLASALGFPNPDKIVPLSRMNELVEERTGAKPGSFGQMFNLNPHVDDLPDKIAVEHNGIKLIVMGGVKTGGGGCACPESTLIKALVRHIILDRNERIIMDMEAGVEHLGRSTTDAVDCLTTVVEPGMRSIQAARRIKDLANQIGIKRVCAIGNKVASPQDATFITENIDNIKVIGIIPYSNSLKETSNTQEKDERVNKEIDKINLALIPDHQSAKTQR
ncbi:MAG: AAA family ATPase [Planctomycetes bacterium]|nr:AAA family ATPase [Planctomycetota bacterium]